MWLLLQQMINNELKWNHDTEWCSTFLCSSYQRLDKEIGHSGTKFSRFARNTISEKELLCSNCQINHLFYLYICMYIYIKRNSKYSITSIKQYFESVSSDIIKNPKPPLSFSNVLCLLFLINASTKRGYTCVMNSVFKDAILMIHLYMTWNLRMNDCS